MVRVFTTLVVLSYLLTRGITGRPVAFCARLLVVAYRAWAFPHWQMLSCAPVAVLCLIATALLLSIEIALVEAIWQFQLDTDAPKRKNGRKRTYRFVLQSLRTLRFELFHLPAKLARPSGRRELRIAASMAGRERVTRVLHTLEAVASPLSVGSGGSGIVSH